MAVKKQWSSKSTNRVKGWKVVVDGDVNGANIDTARKYTDGSVVDRGFVVSPREAEALVAAVQRWLDGREIELSQQEKE